MAFFSGRPIARKLETASSIRDTPQQKLIKTAGGSVSRSASSETARKVRCKAASLCSYSSIMKADDSMLSLGTVSMA